MESEKHSTRITRITRIRDGQKQQQRTENRAQRTEKAGKADSLAIMGIVGINIHCALSNEVMIFHVFNYFITVNLRLLSAQSLKISLSLRFTYRGRFVSHPFPPRLKPWAVKKGRV